MNDCKKRPNGNVHNSQKYAETILKLSNIGIVNISVVCKTSF